ncbi:clusterin isoform X2 [Carettochelys insculpta]|uniref:clusterin isoform X2 n=1 Tax=Carettochelys insculpta TaxID=44489 RepID=UPI003EBB4507
MKLLLLWLLGLLLAGEEGQALVPPSELKQMSATGSKFISAEIENAIDGVKQMKSLMDRTSKDHQEILTTLEETKQKKEQAMQLAKDTEKRLMEKPEVCNETMLALWEECKPCLKQTCMRFYSRTCRSGSGLVGRQLEEFLNHSSPISIWVNGDRIDSLLEEDQQQGRWLEDLEERYSLVEEGVDDLFQESTRVYGHTAPFFRLPFIGGFRGPMHPRFRAPFSNTRVVRDAHPFFSLPHHGFHRLFQPLLEMSQRMFESSQKAMEQESQESLLGGPITETRNSSNDRMVCREIRRNSAGCLKMKDKCEKCREILSVDCSQTDPAQGRLREQLEDALRLAERFSHRYDELLRGFQEEMLNTSSLLDQLSRQFSWVSRLANLTQPRDGALQVTTVLSKAPNPQDPSLPADTQVTVQLFDSDPLSLTVPGEIPWDDPKFMEVVAAEALKHYKQNALE